MLSTVSMMFAPGWRKTMMRIAGLPFARPVVLTSSTESVTLAMSESRRAAPFLYETTSGSYWAALKSWSVDEMDQIRSPRPMSPFGRFVFTLKRNVLTSSRPRPVRERAIGFTSTRTAGSAPPPTNTWPTPGTCASFCWRTEDARSYIRDL